MEEICFRISLVVTLLGLTAHVAARPDAQGTLLWQQTVPNGFAQSVTVDNQRNVIVGGSSTADFTVAKFDRNGTLLWQQNLKDGSVFSVAVDNQSNVIAGGHTQNGLTVAKFDRDGTLLWQQHFNGSPTVFGAALSVAVDKHGDVVAAGVTQQTFHARFFTGYFTVAKFDRDGTLLWQRDLNGSANQLNVALSVAVDKQGNVVAAGFTQNIGTSVDFTVAKFDGDGTLLWEHNLIDGFNVAGEASSVVVDEQGNVVAAGYTQKTFAFRDFTVAKFYGDGTLLWQQSLNGGANFDDQALSVAVDSRGDVVAGGYTEKTFTSSRDFTVAKFDGDGTLLWQQKPTGGANVDGIAFSVAVDKQANVVAAGFTQKTFASFRDLTVAKFDRGGTLLWEQNLNAGASGFGGTSVAVDNQGNAVAAGQTLNDSTVAKFAR